MRQYRIYYNLLDGIPFLNLEIDGEIVQSNIVRSIDEANWLIVYYGVIKNRPVISGDIDINKQELTAIVSYLEKNVSMK